MDLKLEKDEKQIVVQCKHWKQAQVRLCDVRELLGTLMDSKIQKGVFVTLQGYTDDTRAFAAKRGIEIIDETALLPMMQDSSGKFPASILCLMTDKQKIFPKCESEMVLRTTTRGVNESKQFWSCSTYPRCRFKMSV